MRFSWDPDKNKRNRHKHGISLADGIPALEDDRAVTIIDHESDPDEERYVTLGLDAFGRVLVVVYVYRGDEQIHLISAREAEPHEREDYINQ